MKMFIATAFLILPSFAFAEGTVTAAHAASIVRQPAVEECLSVVENNVKGVAQFDSFEIVSTTHGAASSTSTYILKGSNLYGDILAGFWEISVEVVFAEEGQTYSCKIIKNEE